MRAHPAYGVVERVPQAHCITTGLCDVGIGLNLRDRNDRFRGGAKLLREFREFAVKGNMLDLAIGLVLGSAFGAIVGSLVKDGIMPPIGWLLGGRDFSALFVVLKEGKEAGPYVSLADAQKAGAITLNWGVFANAILTFIVVAFAMFFVVKTMNRLKKKEEAAPAAPPKSEVLLAEIRDLLKSRG